VFCGIMMKSFCIRHGIALALLPLVAAGAYAQTGALKSDTTTREKIVGTGKEAGRIASQPARDVGASKVAIPPAVQKAAAAPYSLQGLGSCAQIKSAIFELNDVLGPDYAGAVTVRENKAGKLAAAGGKTIVNTIIPFRGLVREVSGAAPAERRLNAAIRAAYARRGFLRGVATGRKCRLG
jgi:hypothetical protein